MKKVIVNSLFLVLLLLLMQWYYFINLHKYTKHINVKFNNNTKRLNLSNMLLSDDSTENILGFSEFYNIDEINLKNNKFKKIENFSGNKNIKVSKLFLNGNNLEYGYKFNNYEYLSKIGNDLYKNYLFIDFGYIFKKQYSGLEIEKFNNIDYLSKYYLYKIYNPNHNIKFFIENSNDFYKISGNNILYFQLPNSIKRLIDNKIFNSEHIFKKSYNFIYKNTFINKEIEKKGSYINTSKELKNNFLITEIEEYIELFNINKNIKFEGNYSKFLNKYFQLKKYSKFKIYNKKDNILIKYENEFIPHEIIENLILKYENVETLILNNISSDKEFTLDLDNIKIKNFVFNGVNFRIKSKNKGKNINIFSDKKINIKKNSEKEILIKNLFISKSNHDLFLILNEIKVGDKRKFGYFSFNNLKANFFINKKNSINSSIYKTNFIENKIFNKYNKRFLNAFVKTDEYDIYKKYKFKKIYKIGNIVIFIKNKDE